MGRGDIWFGCAGLCVAFFDTHLLLLFVEFGVAGLGLWVLGGRGWIGFV
jgi:hypothetical protein